MNDWKKRRWSDLRKETIPASPFEGFPCRYLTWMGHPISPTGHPEFKHWTDGEVAKFFAKLAEEEARREGIQEGEEEET